MKTWPQLPAALQFARLSPPPSLPGCWYDAAAAETATNFFPWYCRFTAGPKAGQPMLLEEWQRWITRQAFGWKRDNGRRLFRRILIWVPRKNGKTELLAGVSHLALLAFEAFGAEVYSIAAHADQASIVFRAAQAMVAHSRQLAEHYEIRKGSLYCPAKHSVFRPLSGKPHGKHGLKCMLLLGDEAHEWRDGDLHQFVRQSMGTWDEPMEWIISTAGVEEGYGLELWHECEMICSGFLDDPETLVIMFGADAKKDDLSDPAVWRKANPNLGVSIDEAWFAAEVKKALALPRHLNYVRRYHFNIWTSQDFDPWLPPDAWKDCTVAPGDKQHWKQLEALLAGRPCYGGLDLAAVKDMNALVWVFPPAGSDPRWVLLPRFWWPRATSDMMRSKGRIPIETWEADGAIRITDGNAADQKAIEAQVYEDCARFQVMGLGIDEWNALQITVNLTEAGVPVHRIRTGIRTLSAATKQFERLVLEHEIEHGSHPVLAWQAGNTAIKTDEYENIVPTKKRSAGKIDGIVSGIIGMAIAGGDAEQPSYLATDRLLVL